jgi:hypothetical protein
LDINLGEYQVGFGPYLGRMLKAEKWQRVSDTSSSLEDDLNTWDLGGQAYARAPLGKSTFFQARISGSALRRLGTRTTHCFTLACSIIGTSILRLLPTCRLSS